MFFQSAFSLFNITGAMIVFMHFILASPIV